jgi:hypothetical protein
MRVIQHPTVKLDDGKVSAHCNFELVIGDYIISISADNNLGKGEIENGRHNCYRTNMALFLSKGTREATKVKNEEEEKHCDEIMMKAINKSNYVDFPSWVELNMLMEYLKDNSINFIPC